MLFPKRELGHTIEPASTPLPNQLVDLRVTIPSLVGAVGRMRNALFSKEELRGVDHDPDVSFRDPEIRAWSNRLWGTFMKAVNAQVGRSSRAMREAAAQLPLSDEDMTGVLVVIDEAFNNHTHYTGLGIQSSDRNEAENPCRTIRDAKPAQNGTELRLSVSRTDEGKIRVQIESRPVEHFDRASFETKRLAASRIQTAEELGEGNGRGNGMRLMVLYGFDCSFDEETRCFSICGEKPIASAA